MSKLPARSSAHTTWRPETRGWILWLGTRGELPRHLRDEVVGEDLVDRARLYAIDPHHGGAIDGWRELIGRPGGDGKGRAAGQDMVTEHIRVAAVVVLIDDPVARDARPRVIRRVVGHGERQLGQVVVAGDVRLRGDLHEHDPAPLDRRLCEV